MSETHPDRDWREDASHENGNYLNKCCQCELHFIGHKRRVICRKCREQAMAHWETLTPEQQAEERKKALDYLIDRGWDKPAISLLDTKP